MKNIYKTIEKDYLKQKKSKDFDENKFNEKIEEVMKTLYPDQENFEVLKILINGVDFAYVQGMLIDSDETKKMYFTTEDKYYFVYNTYNMNCSNKVAHTGFLTCEDIEKNLELKLQLKHLTDKLSK